MTVSIRDFDGTVRLSGDLLATGGATGDVLTQQADGTYAPAVAATGVTKYSFPFDFEVGGVPIQDDWLTFAVIPAGTMLVAWRAFVTAAWNAGGHLTVNDQPAGAGTNLFRTGQNLQTYGVDTTAVGDAVTETGFYWAAGTSLSVTTDAAAVSGNLDLYLLTYTP